MATPATPLGVANVALSPLTSAMDSLSASVGRLQSVANTATSSLDALTSAISSTVGRFVALYNPAALIRFDLAVKDLNATIGRALLPVLERFTVVIREIGNAVVGLSPAGNKMIGVLAAVGVGLATATVATGVFFGVMSGAIVGLTVLAGALGTATAIATAGISLIFGAVAGAITTFATGAAAFGFVGSEMASLKATLQQFAQVATSAFEALSRRFDQLMTALKPLRDALGELAMAQFEGFTTSLIVMMDAFALHVQLMQPVIMLAVSALKYMTDGIRALTTAVRYFLGIESGSRRGDATGMAVRDVRFGSPEDAWREAMKASFSLGSEGKEDYAQKSALHLLNIWQILDRIDKLIFGGNGLPVRMIERVNTAARYGAFGGLGLLASQRQLHD